MAIRTEEWRERIPQIPSNQADIDALIEVVTRDGRAIVVANGTLQDTGDGFLLRGQSQGYEARLKANHGVWAPGLTVGEAKEELMRTWRSLLR